MEGVVMAARAVAETAATQEFQRFWQDRNVLVTGAPGLLGSHIADKLAIAGANVHALVRDFVPRSRMHAEGPAVTLIPGDLTDYPTMERAVGDYEVDTVLHLGAQAIVGVANRNPLSTFESNIRGTWTLLEVVRRASLVTRVVVASSDKAYGEHELLPYTEELPLRGRHPYDVSKSCADLLTQAYIKTYGLRAAITRCGNLYGPGDLNYNRLVPGTIRACLRGKPVEIRSDGTPIRDYLYVEDGAAAVLALAQAMDRDDVVGEAFNFSNEDPRSVMDIVTLIRKLVGLPTPQPRISGAARNEIPNQALSAAKARKVLNWTPNFDLEDGLRRTIAWYKARLMGGPS